MNEDAWTNDISEVLDVVSEKVPNLIRGIYEVLFSEEGATSMGKGVSTFYKHLIDAGMDKDDAMKLTRDYMGTLNSMANQLKSQG